jgi:WD40 repeat protein
MDYRAQLDGAAQTVAGTGAGTDASTTTGGGADDRLSQLLLDREEARAAGKDPSPEELCTVRGWTELVDKCRQMFARLQLVGDLLSTMPGGDGKAAEVPELRGRYRLTGFHAAGGLGVVYLAEDAELRRTVAVKRLSREAALQADAARRFVLEAEITGRLEHPGVVPIHGLCADDADEPYYAMRFIKGETLGDAIDRFHKKSTAATRNVELRRLLTHFVAVCETAAYAHSRGVIHRDLKPANIMVGQFGETFVMDWGLAKFVGANEASPPEAVATGPDPAEPGGAAGDGIIPSVQGEKKGSPAYMSPEQARGENDRLGPASDVYSLGAILYHALTGRYPPEGKTRAEVIANVARGSFPPPHLVKPDVPKALEAVGLKAMAFQPEGRYAGAKELAADVERWLADEPVSAWREPFALRARRWLKRHRTLVTGTGATVLVGLCAAVALAVQQRESNRELTTANGDLATANGLLERARHGLIKANLDLTGANAALTKANAAERAAKTEAVEKGRLAEENRRLARRTLYPALMNLVGQSLAGQLDERAAALLREAMPLPGDPDDFRRFEWSYAWDALTRGRLGTVQLPGRASRLQMPADGTVLAAKCGSSVVVVRVADGERLLTLPAGRFDGRFALARDGRRLAFQERHTIELWRFGPDGKPAFERTIKAFDHSFDELALTADGSRVVACGDGNRLRVWDANDGRLLHDVAQFVGEYSSISSFSVSADGAWAAFVREGKPVLVRLSPKRRLVPLPFVPFPAALDWVESIEPKELPPGTFRRAALTDAGSLCVWSGGRVWSWPVGVLALRPDAPPERTIEVKDEVSQVWEFPAPPDGREGPVLYVKAAKRPLVFRTPIVHERVLFKQGRQPRLLPPVAGTIAGAGDGPFTLRPDGKVLASADHTGRVTLLDAARAADPELLLRHPNEFGVRDLHFLPDGRLLSLSARAGLVRGRPGEAPDLVLGIAEPDLVRTIEAPSPTMAVAPDGRWTAVRREKRIEIADAANPGNDCYLELVEVSRPWGRPEVPLALVPGRGALMLAPEVPGKGISSFTPGPCTLAEWDFGRFQGLTLGGACVGGAALLPRLNAVALPRTVREVSVPSKVLALDVSADGTWVAAACVDGAVRVYRRDKLTAAPRRLDAGPPVRCVRFAPDGRSLAAGCADGSIWLFPLAGDGEPLRIPAHTSAVACLVFDGDGRTVISGGEDGAVRFLTREQPQERFALATGVPVTALALAADGRTLAVGGNDGYVRLYRAGGPGDVLKWARRQWAERAGERGPARDLLLALWAASRDAAAAQDGPAAQALLGEAREVGSKLPEELRPEFAAWLKTFADQEKK